jgi:ABC-type branched-subunit amino acid transport system substrate-binding protein
MSRPHAWLVVLSVLAGCTSDPGVAPVSPSPPATSGTPSPAPSEALALDVVADLSAELGTMAMSNTYLDGVRLAVEEVNDGGGVGGLPIELLLHDHGGDPAEAERLVGEVLGGDPVALLHVGPGAALVPHRPRFLQTGVPVVLLEGDLYTGRALFPQVFQTTIPWEWQANEIARYVVTDREDQDVVFLGSGPEAGTALDAFETALAYWGGDLGAGFVVRSGRTPGRKPSLRAVDADRVVVFGTDAVSPIDLVKAVEDLAQAEGRGDLPGFTAASALLGQERGASLPAGTTACDRYTWAGWAEPIPRVGRFRDRLAGSAGGVPVGHEQEGYDAVKALTVALRQTGGRGGPELVDALEGIVNRTFSGFPVSLGPDDHLFAPRDELGLFAVPGRNDELDPWLGENPWMPVMRTFTYDGERTNFLERDRTVFFPFWNENIPSPKYWRSRYGIVSRPGEDRLH